MIWMVVLLTPVLAWASPQDRPEQREDETLRDYLNRVAPIEQVTPEDQADVATDLVSSAVTEQAVSPMGTATASSFGDRVSNTLQNFLPLFQGAINGLDTSDDERTVTLRLNPIRGARFGELGLSASATEPSASEALLEELPSDIRPGQKEAIQKTLEDFTDLTYTATYNYARRLEKTRLGEDRRWYFGRNPRLYEEVFARFVGDTLTSFAPRSNAARRPFEDRLGPVAIQSLTRRELETRLGISDSERLVEILIDERRTLAALNVAAGERAELFADLVANQPQASLSAAYHDRDPLVGRNETSANLSIEMPAAPNINELLRSWRATGDWQKALDDLAKRTKEIEAGTKWSIVASWKEAEPYRVSYLPTTEGAADVTLDRPRSNEISIKAQYTRNATWQRLMVEGLETFPALHLAAELIDVSDDPDREDRRIVGTLTYDVPVRKGVSFPISLVYANKPEFLGDADHQFSAHFGLSLNSLFGDQAN
ncbi:MAG TPA: hypothetical protein VEL74_16910 [Thermoanaerobaculia bacterium]|nr:hypothetical protein [Thermoanaerobaculia bacterium]